MPHRTLLVDDEPSTREGLSKSLGAKGYEVVLAQDGQEAIREHGAERVDLLLLDLNLPCEDYPAALQWPGEPNPLPPLK